MHLGSQKLNHSSWCVTSLYRSASAWLANGNWLKHKKNGKGAETLPLTLPPRHTQTPRLAQALLRSQDQPSRSARFAPYAPPHEPRSLPAQCLPAEKCAERPMELPASLGEGAADQTQSAFGARRPTVALPEKQPRQVPLVNLLLKYSSLCKVFGKTSTSLIFKASKRESSI